MAVGFRRQGSTLRTDDVRAAAIEDARLLALELGGLRPPQTVDPIAVGVALEVGERAHRLVPLELRVLEAGWWTDGEPCQVLLTDRRLLLRRSHGELASLWWGSAVGLEVDLVAGRLVLDYGDGRPRGLSGPGAAVAAAMAVAGVYGLEGLITHPGLAGLREHSPTLRPT
ncbi:hypothetical protein N864_16465 [Intrasporangium chromatireducens Q5-1]|uniref:Uncharacterized protein n=1 Tax=Intrasporangium chromatireducens Q5-1 TaxID=584657 RepID=W9GPS8_9MICO|nr:hypothetical protein [Intrasporangium chromatireducens]EWT06838.1 hypothetical protein N864_16465 [Intrasporangium chromatireducens Q5-1]